MHVWGTSTSTSPCFTVRNSLGWFHHSNRGRRGEMVGSVICSVRNICSFNQNIFCDETIYTAHTIHWTDQTGTSYGIFRWTLPKCHSFTEQRKPLLSACCLPQTVTAVPPAFPRHVPAYIEPNPYPWGIVKYRLALFIKGWLSNISLTTLKTILWRFKKKINIESQVSRHLLSITRSTLTLSHLGSG